MLPFGARSAPKGSNYERSVNLLSLRSAQLHGLSHVATADVTSRQSPACNAKNHFSNISSNGTAQTNSPPRTESVRVRAGINVAHDYPREPGHRAGRIGGTAATRQTHYKNKLIKEFRPHSSQTKYLTSTAPEHYSSKYLASTAPSLLEVHLHSHGGGKRRIQLRTQLQHTSGETKYN